MIKVKKVDIKPLKNRIARALINYHDLSMECEIWLWRNDNLFVRMPEIPIKDGKIRILLWESKYLSDVFQKEVLTQIYDMSGLNLEKALEIRKNWSIEEKARKDAAREAEKLKADPAKEAVRAANQINKVKQMAENEKLKAIKKKPFVPMSLKGFNEVILPKDDVRRAR